MISSSRLAELVGAAGYARETPLAIGVAAQSREPVFCAQGSASDGAAFGPESRAYAASLAKQLTGACAALLAQRGDLSRDDPIAEWLPELPRWREQVRVRHLVHHTAGLPDVWPRMRAAGASDWTSPGVLSALAATERLEREPGSAHAYSNEGYICLATIVERISGSTLDTFARTHIFEPLAMANSVFWAGPGAAPPGAAAVPARRSPAPLSVGDGGLWSSVGDLLRWNGALLDDSLGVATTLHTPGTLDDGSPLDYAWGVSVIRASGETVQSHGGSFGRATAKLVRLPDRSAGFAALSADSSVERMVALGDALRQELIEA